MKAELEPEPEYRALLAVDIERSAGRGNVPLLRIREVLATALRAAFEESGIDWHACLRDDLGDGIRVTAPPGLRKTKLLHPLIGELAAHLRAHNRTAAPATQVRVRAALHAGEVYVAPSGQVTGRPLEVLARLLDAPPARAALAAAPTAVTTSLLLSQHFHEETVRHGYPGIDPETFQEVTFTEKEHTAHAWLHLPGLATPPAPQAPVRHPRPEGSRMTNRASGHGTLYATQNGTQHIHNNETP